MSDWYHEVVRCARCGEEHDEPGVIPAACEVCGYDGYSDADSHRAKSFMPNRRRPLPDDYEPQWDPRERD